MTAVLEAPKNGREASRFLEAYARKYHAGAFAVPIASAMEEIIRAGDWRWTSNGVGFVQRRLTRSTLRKDFTGRQYTLREGSLVVTNLAALPDSRLPDFDRYATVYSHIEDRNVTRQLREQGREVRAVRVSAASEIIAAWGRAGEGYAYPPSEKATLVQLPLEINESIKAAVSKEAKALVGWHDDFPYYSDGSWAALSLRGFNPADPTWGIKPAEMSKSWKIANPEWAQVDRCDWTVLAKDCPKTVDLVKSITWWGELERVRLLRMAGTGHAKLDRHSDITDRAAGVRDGLIARFHIPIITDPLTTMTAWNLEGRMRKIHLPSFTMWYLDARKPHAVANPTSVDRIHLVVDVKSDRIVRDAISVGHEFAA